MKFEVFWSQFGPKSFMLKMVPLLDAFRDPAGSSDKWFLCWGAGSEGLNLRRSKFISF